MPCFFSRRLNGDAKGRMKSEGKAFACILSDYMENQPGYIICGGDLDACAVRQGYVSRTLEDYWNSPERVHHEHLRDWAKAEKGKK